MKLKTSAQKIQEIFTKNKLEFQVIELSHSTRTAQDAANALSCEIAQIVKSLIFYENISKNPILILASGINKVSEKIIEKEIGAKISKADAQFVRQVTGFAIGGVPPLGHIQKIKTYIDNELFKWEDLWAAAGTPNAVFKLKAQDLVHLTSGKVITINSK
jgi:prolyl-tRNA editing enzyme YbaK/EbsC (Cys-tRNA(Pro) deacylase)